MPALISVIIPTFRRPQLVLRAVRSVLCQTLRELELIVVVDGDDGETRKALASIADPRLRVMALPERIGSAAARNVGVGEARTGWIAFLDDDDEWFPQKLKIQLETAEQCSSPHPIVSCRFIARSEEGDLIWPRRTPAAGEPISEYLFCQNGIRGGEGLVLPSTLLTTKELMLQVPFRADLPRHNDVDWLLRATGVPSAGIMFVSQIEPQAVWHIETNRARISNTSDWRYSLGWIEENRALVTARAYASFLLIWVSSTAARGRGWHAFWLLPWRALQKGEPRAVDFLAHLMIWLVPRSIRNRIAVFLDQRKKSLEHSPNMLVGTPTREQKRVSVVLATRNRSALIPEAVRSILQNDHPDFEVVVVDQSDDDVTEAALEPLLSDPRIRYFRDSRRGRSAGQNAGFREARGALVLMTDDDCTVPADWIEQFEAAFAVDPRIGIVFGNVVPAPWDPTVGCIPAYIRQEPFLARSVRDKYRVEGIGACMAVRHTVWSSLGGFDEMLGSGSRFKAGEDGDLAMRTLYAGHWIYETPAISVTHFGLRTWEQLPALMNSYWYGVGAMMIKPIKIGQWHAVLLLLRLAAKWVSGRSTVGSSLGPRSHRLRKLRAFFRGFWAGATVPVSKAAGHYVSPALSQEFKLGRQTRHL
jgi:glycosyltransferase involved in cell wall biosynthesis